MRRRVLITGATRGLGRAMALRFSREGHTVLGCGRDEAAVARLAREMPAPHDFAVVDVADDEAVAAWMTRIRADEAPPDLLLNNAAVITPARPLWEVSAEDFSLIIDINIKGVTNVIRRFLPSMRRARKGVVVNFSSGWGRSADAGFAPYCATKWAVEGLTKALALELPKGMAAVAFSPGVIRTDMLETAFGEEAARYPLPDTWAEKAVPFLLSLGEKENGASLSLPGA